MVVKQASKVTNALKDAALGFMEKTVIASVDSV